MKYVKPIGYWLLMGLILIGLNTASVVWLVYNFLPSPQIAELSMWDIGILKSQLDLAPAEYLSVSEKGCIYLFMVVGAIISAFYLKWLFIDTITRFREKAKQKKSKFSDLEKQL